MMISVGNIGVVGAAARRRVGSVEPETAALVARFTTPPTADRRVLINDMVKALKTAGVWSKLAALHVLAAADSQAARRNWIADQYNLTAYSSPVFTADRGFTGDASAARLGSGYDHALAAQDDFSMGVWCLTDGNTSTWIEVGAERARIASRQGTSFGSGLANGGTQLLGTLPAPTSIGHLTWSRDNASDVRMYKNGAAVPESPIANASSGTQSREILVLARSSSGSPTNYSGRQVAATHWGRALSQAETAALYGALNTYLQAVGAA